MPHTQSITDTLATLSISKIFWTALILTLLRLPLVRLRSVTARTVADLIETILIAFIAVFLVIRPFIGQTNFIPTGSMEPTLHGENGVGDHILVNKFLYRFRQPQHDDVVVFIAPPQALQGTEAEKPDDVDFIKRLIGRPHDIVQAVAGKITIDGTLYYHEDVRRALISHGIFGTAAMSARDDVTLDEDHVKFTPDGVLANGKPVSKKDLAQMLVGTPNSVVSVEPGYTMLNGQRLNEPFVAEDPDYDLKLVNGLPLKHDYNILLGNYKYAGQDIDLKDYDRLNAMPADAIPADHFFMMGDNRNDSDDSTDWGPLEASRAVGRAQVIFWPFNRIRIIR